jgi:hypothetical protein
VLAGSWAGSASDSAAAPAASRAESASDSAAVLAGSWAASAWYSASVLAGSWAGLAWYPASVGERVSLQAADCRWAVWVWFVRADFHLVSFHRVLLLVDLVWFRQALVAGPVADHFQADFPDSDFQGGYSDSRQDGSPEEDEVWADDSLVDDSSNGRHIQASRNREQGGGGTSNSADGRALAIPPKRCDCNRPCATTSSIPSHPSPMAECSRPGC